MTYEVEPETVDMAAFTLKVMVAPPPPLVEIEPVIAATCEFEFRVYVSVGFEIVSVFEIMLSINVCVIPTDADHELPSQLLLMDAVNELVVSDVSAEPRLAVFT